MRSCFLLFSTVLRTSIVVGWLSSSAHFGRHLHRGHIYNACTSINHYHSGKTLLFSTNDKQSTPIVVDANTIPDYKRRMLELSKRIDDYVQGDRLRFKELPATIKDLEIMVTQEGFWDNQSKAQRTLVELNKAKDTLDRIKKWRHFEGDIKALLELVSELSPEDAKGMIIFHFIT